MNVSRQLLASLNSVLRCIDRPFVKNAPEQAGPLFILGAPRSGTTLTYQVVVQNLMCCYFTAPMGYVYGAANLLHHGLRPALHRPAGGFDSRYGRIRGLLAPSEHAALWLHWLRPDPVRGDRQEVVNIDFDRLQPLARTVQSISAIMQRPLVIKCVYLSLSAAVLAQLFPKALFIHVSRELTANCQSIITARRELRRTTRWWSVRPPGYSLLLQTPLWQQAATQVLCVNSVIGDDLGGPCAARCRNISYEDLCDKPGTILDDLIAWLAPAGFTPYPERHLPARFKAPRTVTLPPEDVADIKAITLHDPYRISH